MNMYIKLLNENISRAIRFERLKKRWRQIDLAEKSGVSQKTISNIERGQSEAVMLQNLAALAKALDLELYELMLPDDHQSLHVRDISAKYARLPADRQRLVDELVNNMSR